MTLNQKFVRKNRGLNVSRIENEILLIEANQDFRGSPGETPELASFNPHKIILNGETGWAYDAKAINTQFSQTGRGDYRYFFQDKEFTGMLLIHNGGRNYARA